jgi:glycosyltransferase involved in cell wall biosynthesis
LFYIEKESGMKLSVIVCTRNRANAIIPCLDSIAASLAKAAPVDAEIVVIDNGSTNDTSDLVRRWASTCAFPVNLQLEPRKGLSIARNCGIRIARGDLLAWTDDDCRMSESYIKELLRHDAADTELVLRGGRVELGDPGDLPVTIKRIQKRTRWSRALHSARHENIGNCLLGCNMAMRRSIAERLGPFDERFGAGSGIPGGEDIDYTFRAYLAGIVIEAVPDMTVYHHHGRKQAADGAQLFRDYTIGGGALYAKYIFKNPDLCRQFYWDVKNSIRETISGKNTFMPEFGFSHKDKVIYSALGAARYSLQSLRRKSS